jgi:glycerophosphoryl diester phosphodiesterase
MTKSPLAHLLSHRLRGFSPHESSLSGLRSALTSKARYLEIDTRVTADGEILVLHDARLNRLTHATGPVLRWRSRTNGSPLFKGSPTEPIARFEEFISMFAAAQSGQVLMVDVKDYGAEQEHYRILERYGVLDQVEIVSWLPEVLLRWHEIDPARPLSFSHVALTRWSKLARVACSVLGTGSLLRLIGRQMCPGTFGSALQDVILRFDDENRKPVTANDLAQLQGTFPIHLLDRLPDGAVGQALLASRGSVGVHASMATAHYIKMAQAEGLRVFLFSVDDPEQVLACLAMAPDIIFTNDARLFDFDWTALLPPGVADIGESR